MHHLAGLGKLKESLRAVGLRLTPQRIMVLEALLAGENHMSAEEIHHAVARQYPSMDISTVYRTLQALEDMGLVASARYATGETGYHLAEKARHHHFLCQGCGQEFEFDDAALQSLREGLLRQYGFEASLTHLVIPGRCAACRERIASSR